MISDYDEQRKAARREINARNKRRAKNMELRIMRLLNGNRVPMSGSGSIKGDGQLFSKIGYILVECKCTERVSYKGIPEIFFSFFWMKELEKDTKSMRAALGILIFHYVNTRNDYVAIERSAFEKYFYIVDEHIPVINRFNKKSFVINKDNLDTMLNDKPIFLVVCQHGEYIFMRLEYLQELLKIEEEE